MENTSITLDHDGTVTNHAGGVVPLSNRSLTVAAVAIKNLSMDCSDNSLCGGVLATHDSCDVSDTLIDGLEITGYSNIGGVCAGAEGGSLNDIRIKNATLAGASKIGGLIGELPVQNSLKLSR